MYALMLVKMYLVCYICVLRRCLKTMAVSCTIHIAALPNKLSKLRKDMNSRAN